MGEIKPGKLLTDRVWKKFFLGFLFFLFLYSDPLLIVCLAGYFSRITSEIYLLSDDFKQEAKAKE